MTGVQRALLIALPLFFGSSILELRLVHASDDNHPHSPSLIYENEQKYDTFDHEAKQLLTSDLWMLDNSNTNLESSYQKLDIEKNFDILPESVDSLVLSSNSLDEVLAQSEGPLISLISQVDAQTESAGSRPSLRTTPNSPDEPIYRPRADIILEEGSKYGPGINILAPTAFGKQWRQFSVGFGYQQRTRFTNNDDGAFGFGLGFGDARKYVGIDVGITFTDLSSIVDRGIVSFKIHRKLPSDFAVAVGVNDAITWGNGDIDGPSPYAVLSKAFYLKSDTNKPFSRLYVSAGVGSGRYRTEANIFTDNDDPGLFGGIAVRVFDPVSVITEWSGQDLSVGLSLRPFKKIPFIITPAATDITGTAGDGVRFIFGVGYATSF